jgi:hypothetical protein
MRNRWINFEQNKVNSYQCDETKQMLMLWNHDRIHLGEENPISMIKLRDQINHITIPTLARVWEHLSSFGDRD